MSPRGAYQQARRDAARARGDCLQCCKRPATSKSRCEQCLVVNARRYAEKQGHAPQEGKHCSSCSRTGHDARTCPEQPYVRASKQWCDECIACGFHRAGCPKAEERA